MTATPARVNSTVEGGLVHLRLAHAEGGNVLDLPMIEALADAIARIDPATARAVLISAEGRNFSVGGDLRGMAAADDRGALLRRMADVFHDGLRRLEGLGVPVVVAVNGNAAGGGLSLALAGDILIGGESSGYMMAYTAIGLSADGGSTFRLPKLIGLRLTQEMAYLGRRLNAAEALAAGLITRVVPDDAVLGEALAVARQLSAGPTGAFRRMKALIDAGSRTDFAHHVDSEADAIAAAAAGHDGGEGVRAFLERRPPAFTGE
jgi:2-(1,2-epoxy-1,2-dihydrophenyl)acetyl-CoA isomerase